MKQDVFRSFRRSITVLAAACLVLSGCRTEEKEPAETVPEYEAASAETKKTPKYIFLFIGDGMSYSQIQLTADYLGLEKSGKTVSESLSFLDFPVTGSLETGNAESFCTDSASAGTAMATGKKTKTGVLGMDADGVRTESITEKLKAQKGFRIGLATTVNLNHATPAAFYAHQPSRNLYYEIGGELLAGGFDFLAGGSLLEPTGKKEEGVSLYALAEQTGYQMIWGKPQTVDWTGKVWITASETDAKGALPFLLDGGGGWTLADCVKTGIQALQNGDGFFLMAEAGKIDWACEANDARTMIEEVSGLDLAVQEAVRFQKQHPDDTLILVTGDHETGGLSIGNRENGLKTHLDLLSGQQISFARYEEELVTQYKKQQMAFTSVQSELAEWFGLGEGGLALSEEEWNLLKEAYQETLDTAYKCRSPLIQAVGTLIAEKAGIGWSTGQHSGQPVPVFALGVGEERFAGWQDNTDIFKHLAELTGVN